MSCLYQEALIGNQIWQQSTIYEPDGSLCYTWVRGRCSILLETTFILRMIMSLYFLTL